MAGSRHRLALLLVAAFAGGWIAAGVVLLASARLPAEASGPVLAVLAPDLGRDEASARILAAGGLPLEPTLLGWGWTAYSPVEGFVGRLENQGAWLVIPPLGALRFAGICGEGMELFSQRPHENRAFY